jgi:hypothetical protein
VFPASRKAWGLFLYFLEVLTEIIAKVKSAVDASAERKQYEQRARITKICR